MFIFPKQTHKKAQQPYNMLGYSTFFDLEIPAWKVQTYINIMVTFFLHTDNALW